MSAPAHRDPVVLTRYIQRQIAAASEQGITVTYETDFDELREVTARLDDRPGIFPVFDPRVSETSAANGFWLKGANGAGETVHVQAMRRFDLRETSLADHMERFKRLYTHAELGLSVEASEAYEPWMAQAITGVSAYHGELWVRKDFRKRNMGQILPRTGIAIGQLIWRPAYVFAFAIPEVTFTGLLHRYGYCHVHPKAFLFKDPDGKAVRRAWFVAMRSEEFSDVIWDEEIQESIDLQGGQTLRLRSHDLQTADESADTAPILSRVLADRD